MDFKIGESMDFKILKIRHIYSRARMQPKPTQFFRANDIHKDLYIFRQHLGSLLYF